MQYAKLFVLNFHYTKMKKILHIKSSGRSLENGSFSRLYGHKLMQKIYKKYIDQDICLIERDLMIKKPMFMNDLYSYVYLSEKSETDPELMKKYKSIDFDVIKESNEIISEFQNSDEIIIESPMYNFSVSANLKAYLDLLIIKNKTFDRNHKGMINPGKKIYIIVSSGGSGYQADKSFLNFHTNLLKLLLTFIGVEKENINFLLIEKTSTNPDASNADNFLQNFI
jgi:FMN-dependent NADH-azoreductase